MDMLNYDEFKQAVADNIKESNQLKGDTQRSHSYYVDTSGIFNHDMLSDH